MNYKNFAYSLVATAPVPADTGTSLIVTADQGTRFPAVPFYATVWQAGVMPSVTNAEIVLVTDVTSDTLTITRHQEGTSARVIVVGDQIGATITAATVETFKNLNIQIKTATYLLTSADDIVICNKASAMVINLPAASGSGKVFQIKNINTGAVTVTPDGADTIDEDVTVVLSQWDNVTIVDYAANVWAIL